MNARKTSILSVFLLLAIIQLAVPVNMLVQKERIIKSGVEVKFKILAKDPHHPFSGSYLSLNLGKTVFKLDETAGLHKRDKLYLTYHKDEQGYAIIDSLFLRDPELGENYIQVVVNRVISKEKIKIEYPFNEYYLEENKAAYFDKKYNELAGREDIDFYALVSILNGKTALKQLIINGEDILSYNE